MDAFIWLIGFGSIVWLGLKGGGYDPLVHYQVGIVAWWILLGGVAIGALPRAGIGVTGWTALGLFGAFLAWTALSLIWTESSEQTFADVARIAGYGGFLLLALFVREPGGARKLVAAIGSGIAVIALVALLSRLHPSWFPGVLDSTEKFLPGAQERLAYPLDYWNGLAGLIAIGIPLLAQMATTGRALVVRALAAAVLPAVLLAIYFTLSRGGIAAAVAASLVFFAFTSDRLQKLPTLAMVAVGGAVLIATGASHDSLVHGLTDATARSQGNSVLLLTVIVCAVVGALRAALGAVEDANDAPAWTEVSVGAARIGLAVGVVALIVVALAAGAPHRLSNAWNEFRDSSHPVGGADRLGSIAGENRYAIWSSAVREMKTAPLVGTGSGTFQFWWARDATVDESVIDTHNLYLQTLGELGWIGMLVLIAFLATVLIAGVVAIVRTDGARRAILAAALAGCSAFCVSAAVDWVWQIPVIAVAMLMLAGVLVGAGGPDWRPGLWIPWPGRLGFGLAAIGVIVVIAIPLAATTMVRKSQDHAREGNLTTALSDAKTAVSVEPFAAEPRLQEALVYEGLGELAPAAEAARAATRRESTDWRTWLVLSRLEARRGHAAAAVAAYREARALNPRSSLFRK